MKAWQIVPAFSDAQQEGTADSWATIQAAINSAIASGAELLIPPGDYKTSATLVWAANWAAIRGISAVTTSITASGPGYNTFVVGNGSPFAGGASGYIEGLHLLGNSRPATPTGISCLQLNGMYEFKVESMIVDTNDIGFDMINNCFGSQYTNIRGGFGGTVNVGLYLRTGTQSGSDITINNAWLVGVFAGVCVAGSGGGYHVNGGQIAAGEGTSAPNDLAGAFVLGYDYLTAVTGSCSVDIRSTSFEGTNNAWVFRSCDQTYLVADAIGMNPTSQTSLAIGVYKGTNAKNAAFSFRDVTISGFWSNPQLIVADNSYASPTNQPFLESGTQIAAQAPTINGKNSFGWMVDAAGKLWASMLGQSGLSTDSVID
jgi:hypothetical protein